MKFLSPPYWTDLGYFVDEIYLVSELESLRTSSRTHFEVLGLDLEGQALGLEAISSQKLPCPRVEDSTILWMVKIL